MNVLYYGWNGKIQSHFKSDCFANFRVERRHTSKTKAIKTNDDQHSMRFLWSMRNCRSIKEASLGLWNAAVFCWSNK